MTSFTGSQLGYPLGQLLLAKILAYNQKGWSIESTPNTIGILAQGKPQIGSNISSAVSSLNSALLTWSEITSPDNGYNTVNTYSIYSDQGLGGSLSYLTSTNRLSKTV